MKNNRWLTGIIIVLVLMNAGLLFTVWQMKPPFPPPGREQAPPPPGVKMLREELHLSPAQDEQFRKLREQHEEDIQAMLDEIHACKDSAFRVVIRSGGDKEAAKKLMQRAGELQYRLDMATLEHLSALRAVCTPEQRPAFDSVFHHFIAPHGPAPDNGPPPPRRQ
jgi:Spy/CpxP family protein refolding chaperone